MINTEALQKSCLGAIRSLELAYPSFKPDEDVVEFWTNSLMKGKLEPDDIIGGVELFLNTEINNFNVNLPTLISYCKRVKGVRLKKSEKKQKALASNTEQDAFNRDNESAYCKESHELVKELHRSRLPKEQALEVFYKKCKELEIKYPE